MSKVVRLNAVQHCRDCEEPIEGKRLEIIPDARICFACASEREAFSASLARNSPSNAVVAVERRN